MPVFAEAFDRGVQSAELRAQQEHEILEILKKVSQEVAAASGNLIKSVEARETLKTIPDPGVFVIDPSRPFPGRKVKYTMLAATSTSDANRELLAELCEITPPSSGYPVTLRYANRDVRCADAVSLTNAIAEMLEHPETGRSLRSLMTSGTGPTA